MSMFVNSWMKRGMAAAAVLVAFLLGSGARGADAQSKSGDEDFAMHEAFMRGISVEGSTLIIAAGTHATGYGPIELKQAATFTIEPAERIEVQDEVLRLPRKTPESFLAGTPLSKFITYGINGAGALIPESLVLSETAGGAALKLGEDYLLGPEHAMLGLPEKSRLEAMQPLHARYTYSLLRLDSIGVDAQGVAHLIKGEPHIAIPQPPALPGGMTRLMNVFRPYRAETLEAGHLYPILARPEQAVTRTTRGRIPKTLAAIKASHATHIICLGDSVTAGGDVSSPELMFSELLRRGLQKKYSPPAPEGVPLVSINLINESYGGTCSSQWLRIGPLGDYIDKHPEMLGNAPVRINFERILSYRPNLVTIEFVNDVTFPRDVLEQLYGKMVDELHAIGAEVILITPHFCAPEMMQTDDLRTAETRDYVNFLCEFAERRNLAVADASARWAHLWKEGLPYTTLLANTLNHPDDRGHALFAEELMKCFE